MKFTGCIIASMAAATIFSFMLSSISSTCSIAFSALLLNSGLVSAYVIPTIESSEEDVAAVLPKLDPTNTGDLVARDLKQPPKPFPTGGPPHPPGGNSTMPGHCHHHHDHKPGKPDKPGHEHMPRGNGTDGGHHPHKPCHGHHPPGHPPGKPPGKPPKGWQNMA